MRCGVVAAGGAVGAERCEVGGVGEVGEVGEVGRSGGWERGKLGAGGRGPDSAIF